MDKEVLWVLLYNLYSINILKCGDFFWIFEIYIIFENVFLRKFNDEILLFYG